MSERLSVREKKCEKSSGLSPVTRIVDWPLERTRSFQTPGLGSLTLTINTLLRLTGVSSPSLSLNVTPATVCMLYKFQTV